MADLNKPSQIKAYFQTIVARHTELAHFCYGNITRLQQLFKQTMTEDEYVLYLEWPQKRYRDNSGTVDAQLNPSISVLKSCNKENYAAQDAAIEKCMEILDDIIIRMRKEVHLNGHIFKISDMQQPVDPVTTYMIDNCFGCRVPIYLGDWVSVTPNPAKWSDL